MSWEEDDDDAGLDPEGPEQSDVDADDSPALIKCSYCGDEVSEDAERCPSCGSYISEEDAPRYRRMTWYILAVIVALLIIAFVWLH